MSKSSKTRVRRTINKASRVLVGTGGQHRLAWYFVCACCDAKWFAPRQRWACPRCGTTAVSRERLEPPWFR